MCAAPFTMLLKHSPALGVWRGVEKLDEAEIAVVAVVVVNSTEVIGTEVTGDGCTVIVTVGAGD